MLSEKDVKGLTGLINTIIDFLNGLKKPVKQKLALKVLKTKIENLIKEN